MFDADPNGKCYIDYTSNQFVPSFSHHKLSCFEYVDGTNPVIIDDDFITNTNYGRTDLEMYYEKVGLAYGPASGREIENDYPSANIDIEPRIDEYRIVGSTGLTVGITSIRSGNGITPSTTITVDTEQEVPGLEIDTPFRIQGITASGYNGQFIVYQKISGTQIRYQVQNAPSNPLPSATGASLSLTSDSVTSSSPYISHVSLRSVYGMCGLLADGDKSTGFKSMMVGQFTGIGLQKDDNAFLVYNSNNGTYQDNTVPGNETISTNSKAIFKPSYENFHIKSINEAFIQTVSVFAIGYAEHFSVETGGDMSVTNSNSNFGAKSLVSSGFRRSAFSQDDLGYITHIIPPKEISNQEIKIEYKSIDVNRTIGVSSSGQLYLYNETNSDIPPQNVIEGYRIGARTNDNLIVLISTEERSAKIVMPGSNSSGEKVSLVGRSNSGINSIASNTFTLSQPHSLVSGESVRVLSDSGRLPDGIQSNALYYAIVQSPSQIKLAATQNEAIAGNPIIINNLGGTLKIVSRVSDKKSGDIGHPIQYNNSVGQWYINVSTASSENTIYSSIVSLGSGVLGDSTPRTYISRQQDTRSSIDRIYRVRYVIPSSSGNIFARPPSDGFILQESNRTIGFTDAEIQTYFGIGELSNETQLRNPRFIANASMDQSFADITTELPHQLEVGNEVEILNVKSGNNTSGTENLGYNGTYTVISIDHRCHFRVSNTKSPGTFTSSTSLRTTALPYFRRKKYNTTSYIHRIQEAQKYIPSEQDGVYYLTLLNSSNSPSLQPFTNEKFSQPVKELYPQKNRDNPVSDPNAAKSVASNSLIGDVIVNDVRKSITKETIHKNIKEYNVGIGITNIISNSSTEHTVLSSVDHGLNRIVSLTITNPGNYTDNVLYNVPLVSFGSSTTGQYATAKVTIQGGSISSIRIMNGGSAYGIGNTLTLSGVPGTVGAVLRVDKIYNNVNDVIRISGVSPETYEDFNDLYRITNVQVGAAKSFVVQSTKSIGIGSVTGIPLELSNQPSFHNTGRLIRVNTISYSNITGIATVTTLDNHGLRVDNKIRITGADQSVYNGDFIVTENVGSSSLKVRIGISTTAPPATGTIYIYREGITSNEGVITNENENISGRMVPVYAGITTALSALIPGPTDTTINDNAANIDINVGDYLSIDDEIVRVKEQPSGTTPTVKVFRGVLGTRATNHDTNSVVRRVHINPIELRRHSIIRASGHTFEYVGYGPGNYSTALPGKQDRQLSHKEELLAQSTRKEGGINFYTGMNDKGNSYSGNKKLSTVTGREEIFDTPVQTIVGEDIGDLPSLNVSNATEILIERSINVEGGNDNNVISQFGGPVIFNNKVTVGNDLETNSLYLQGDATVSRKYTVGISTPILSGNPGDIVYQSNPIKSGFMGWVYTLDNQWFRWGNVSISQDLNIGIFDQIGIGTDNPNTQRLLINSNANQVSISTTGGVGIGTTANGYKLNVVGNTNISGNVYGSFFIGDGSGLTAVNPNATGWTNISGGIYNTYLNNVGVGTSVPRFNLEVGAVGAGGTSLWVNNTGRFDGTLSANNTVITGILTATSYNLSGGTGSINAGIVTSSTLSIGSGGLTLTTVGSNVGVGTLAPRSKLDVEGLLRIKTTHSVIQPLSISSNIVAIDLAIAQNFTLNLSDKVVSFTVSNPPSDVSSFTLVITQDAIGDHAVAIDVFGGSIPVYWPGGGVLPIMTPTALRTDIYTFNTFDGGATWYAVVVGQNFTN